MKELLLLVVFGVMAAMLLLRKIRWNFAIPDVKDKVVFISGGSSGIGEEMAK